MCVCEAAPLMSLVKNDDLKIDIIWDLDHIISPLHRTWSNKKDELYLDCRLQRS